MTLGCHPADLFLGCTMLQALIYIELNVYCRYVKLDQIGLHTHNDLIYEHHDDCSIHHEVVKLYRNGVQCSISLPAYQHRHGVFFTDASESSNDVKLSVWYLEKTLV